MKLTDTPMELGNGHKMEIEPNGEVWIIVPHYRHSLCLEKEEMERMIFLYQVWQQDQEMNDGG